MHQDVEAVPDELAEDRMLGAVVEGRDLEARCGRGRRVPQVVPTGWYGSLWFAGSVSLQR